MKKVRLLYRILFFAPFLFLVFGCAGKNAEQQADDSLVNVKRGDPDRDSVLGRSVRELAAAQIKVVSPGEDVHSPDTRRIVSLPHNGRPSLLYFNATWCSSCKEMTQVLVELEDTYDDRMNFVNIDIDHNPDMERRFGITSVPTYVFIDCNGKAIYKVEGIVEQTMLENRICRIISR